MAGAVCASALEVGPTMFGVSGVWLGGREGRYFVKGAARPWLQAGLCASGHDSRSGLVSGRGPRSGLISVSLGFREFGGGGGSLALEGPRAPRLFPLRGGDCIAEYLAVDRWW